ncbi:M81 family metallopeptidase [SAR92 clade bacterium H246]
MNLFAAVMLAETSDLTPISTTSKEWRIESPSNLINGKETIFFNIQKKIVNMAVSKGWSVHESIVATAMPPGGRTVQAVYENIRSTILSDLEQAMPVDAVFLQLHGAMLAHGYDDCEGDLLRLIREVIGAEVPIAIELDPHCHISQGMMEDASLIVLYKTWLHTDIEERAEELFNLLVATVEKKIKPTMALFDCQMIDMYDEAYEPMKSFLNKIYQQEKLPGVLSISPVHGFPLADIPDMGSKMLVITDNNPELANQLAEELGREFFGMKGQQFGQEQVMSSNYLDIPAAISRGQSLCQSGDTPVKLIEWADMAGCGFPTDGTELVSFMLAEGINNIAIGFMCDPLAVACCMDAGIDAELLLRIGGKASALSGIPLDLRITVKRLFRSAQVNTWLGDVELGDTAVVSSGETDFVLTSKRAVGYGIENFEALGVEIEKKDYVICKYLRDDQAINVLGSNFNPINWGFQRITRPKWPWDKNVPGSGEHL